MKILVTGAAGFIGGALARHLTGRGWRVFVDAQRDNAGSTRRWPLTETVLQQAMAGEVPDVIVHAAGSGTVAKVAGNPTLELPANLAAFLAVLDFAAHHARQARVLLLSSAALYGDAPAEPQAEDAVRAPVSLYGLAKLQTEQLANFYAERDGIASVAIRFFSVYGPGLRKQLLWDAMNKFAAGRSEFFGTGAERRDWVHIDDVCSFVDHLLARRPRRAFDVYNCAGTPASTAEVLALLAAAAGAPEPRFNGQSRAGDPMCLVGDCTKARRELGWAPRVDWRDGVAGYAAWFASQAGPMSAREDRA